MATPATKRSYLGHDARRAQILAVAARLFSERSYDAVSTTQIAREAGIARGLVNHYFGTKRELYLEVLRWIFEVPEGVFGEVSDDPDAQRRALAAAVDLWLDTTSRNRATWIAAIGGPGGVGRDPELDTVLEQTRTQIVEQLIALTWGPPARAPDELRTLLLGYGGFAQAVTADWLKRPRMSRAAVHELLLQTLIALVAEVLPRVQPKSTKRKQAR
jgi:AcrR family transcriptional regulator